MKSPVTTIRSLPAALARATVACAQSAGNSRLRWRSVSCRIRYPSNRGDRPAIVTSTSRTGATRVAFATATALTTAASPAAPYRAQSGSPTRSHRTIAVATSPRSSTICRISSSSSAPNAQLNRITAARGNSGANTDPEERRFHR